jgi:hypothetical protein
MVERHATQTQKETTMGQLNETMSDLNEALVMELRNCEWMLRDAKQRVANAADKMLWRAQRCVEDAQALLNDQPCSLGWTEFAEGDLREAKEAKAALERVLERQKLLQYIARQAGITE